MDHEGNVASCPGDLSRLVGAHWAYSPLAEKGGGAYHGYGQQFCAQGDEGQPLTSPTHVWRLREKSEELAGELAARLGVPAVIGKILVQRGVEDEEAGRRFLNPQLTHLSGPEELPGLTVAADRIDQAVRDRERIVIYGDYDVDGTTAVALLCRLLRLAKAEVDYYVPSRLEEGYGLNIEAMERIREGGAKLVITVDCGITAIDEAAFLADAGIDLIVTDHHEPSETQPRAAAIVNPKLNNDGDTFRQLSGVGVAFKLAWAVAQKFSRSERVAPEFRELLVDMLALVALGTVADVVPLVGENRTLVHFGLKQLVRSKLPGIRALIEVSGQGEKMTSRNIAFGLAPRLNAAGRMGDAAEAIELFITDDMENARRLAQSLEEQNTRRQQEQRVIFEEAIGLIEKETDLANDCAIVLSEESWHSGVIGIVASRIVDEYHRPTVVITMEGDVGQGSARSVPAVNLFETLQSVQETLLSFGGHSQAAGLRVERSRLETFRRAFAEEVGRRVGQDDLAPALDVDAAVGMDELTVDAVQMIDRLGPFGYGNRKPVFIVRAVNVVGVPGRVGNGGKHLVMTVRQGNRALRTVAFGLGERLEDVKSARCLDIAFTPFINDYNKSRSVELRIVDLATF